ncbi:AraC family transcriptional regulator, arabinose operon regulatory protein [Paenibacillus algorifonticola]|uniref:AraC family transcriptional regulator, arabinose operon regulatory protein n=1 Tax=Paenibacillus algorifonticola TaxID=684063 RepID=A0A1I2FPE0_9BACL|nr:helix-turn-helix domain-containing protein [Paenibacillus algorifonticola]SFF07354.1 AraC family transcriptional regulator, arabinose operon regulatory protein [Paenibacillus algorifonticola]
MKRNDWDRRQGKAAAEQSVIFAGHFTENDHYHTVRPNGRSDWLMFYTLQGEGFALTDDSRKRCLPGELTLIRPGCMHEYGTAAGQTWQFVWVHFPDVMAETGLLPASDLISYPIRQPSAGKRIYRAFRRILTDSLASSLYSESLCENSLREILLLLAQQINSKADARIEEAMHLLAVHMTQPLSIGELAHTIGLSPSRLSHLFKASTGYSIIDMHNRMRVRQAALLLEHTKRSASEIAFDVGYQNYNHFAVQFSKVYGTSPRAYRNWKQTPDGLAQQ